MKYRIMVAPSVQQLRKKMHKTAKSFVRLKVIHGETKKKNERKV